VNVFVYTFEAYGQLLDAALDAGYTFLPLREYLRSEELPDRFVLLRHDVDRRPANATRMAALESRRGVAATYYFRTGTFDSETARAMAERGHEIGYHYEDLARANGDFEAAHRRFERNLERFGRSVPIETVCAHGSPLSPHLNTDLWKGRSLAEYDLLGEAYRSIDVGPDAPDGLRYCSDTGRTWRTPGSGIEAVATTADLLAAIESGAYRRVYLLAHPCRWADGPLELAGRVAWDLGAESAKFAVGRIRS
jgi:hypothetical protein